MPTITRLVQGKKNPNRVNLYLDEQFAFALSIDEVAKHSLKKGLELDSEQIEALKDTDATDYIFAKLLNFLSYRPRTVKEVRDRLYKYEVKDTAKQNALIERLKSKGYLDDLAFARWFIESRNAHRPRSSRLLTAELKSKGVENEVIQSVISGVSNERETIVRLLAKKLGSPRHLELNERQKISTYLARLGFAWDKIVEVVKSWESE
ncbi:MAG: regulatory protein RecX [uncultured bacterium]|nr:MAG: regulatory protein RecX [uncultured bacterium]KKU13755.1 MAG: Regulatory protein RecX [Microgenomates group bacterium GW2011_GWC2_45_8]KKU26355.1 MAG: Regulatory protein RecX [Microgenomates group bacterium GW2011_GWA2_46_16]